MKTVVTRLQSATPRASWFKLGGGHPTLRVFCFPHAGAGTTAYRMLARELPPWVELLPMLPAGREARVREAPLTSVAAMAKEAAAAMSPALDRPYMLYGHSLGGLVAFETARLLRRTGRRPPERLLVGAVAPAHSHSLGDPIHQLGDDQLCEVMTRWQGTAAEVLANPALREFFLPIIRCDLEAYETYEFVSDSPLECGITGFAGATDTRIQAARMLGWGKLTVADFRLNQVDGGHFFIAEERAHFRELLQEELELWARTPRPS